MSIAITIYILNKNKIVHTDIIGANIIITNDLQIKIIDFDFSIISDKNIKGVVIIDIYSFIVMVSQIIFEQIYLNKNYSLFNNKDIIQKEIIMKNFLTNKGITQYKSCIEFIDKTFKND